MASRCCELGLLVKPLLKWLGIFHFRTKNSLKWMNLESREKKKVKVVQLNYIFCLFLSLYFAQFTLQLFESVVGSCLSSEGFSLGSKVFLPPKTNIYKFQFDLEIVAIRATLSVLLKFLFIFLFYLSCDTVWKKKKLTDR